MCIDYEDIKIKFRNNHTGYCTSQTERDFVSNGFVYPIDENTSFKELFSYITQVLENMYIKRGEFSKSSLFSNYALTYGHRLFVNGSQILIFDLRTKIIDVINQFKIDALPIILSANVDKGGDVLRLNGMRFFIYSNENTTHFAPHVHVSYQGKSASISIENSSVLSADKGFNKKRLSDAQYVISDNKQSMLLKWNTISNGQKFEFKNNLLVRIF